MGFIKKSKITLFLENDKYLPGSQIKGSVSLSLNKPLKAKSLKVYLIGQKIIRQRMPKFGIGGFKARNSRINEVKYIFFNQVIQLAGEEEYSNQSYSFEIKIPDDILDISRQFIQKELSADAYEFLQSAKAKEMLDWDEKDRWFVEARLSTF